MSHDGRESDAGEIARARYRAAPKPAAVPVGVEVTGPNTWAVTGSGRTGDGLATYNLLAGPGIPGVVGPR